MAWLESVCVCVCVCVSVCVCGGGGGLSGLCRQISERERVCTCQARISKWHMENLSLSVSLSLSLSPSELLYIHLLSC